MTLNPDAFPQPTPKGKAFVLLRAALAKKASDPILIRLDRLTPITDYFLIISGTSARQVQAISEAIMEEARASHMERLSAEGVHQGNWALLDYGDVIVHVFQPKIRQFYDLEGLWSEAPREVFPDEILSEIQAAQAASEDDLDEFD
jgi:ribosome silencing factor RsfS/YbeB/iojap